MVERLSIRKEYRDVESAAGQIKKHKYMYNALLEKVGSTPTEGIGVSMTEIPVEKDPLPERFHFWDKDEQEEFLEEELCARDYIDIICYHAEIPKKPHQEESQTLTEEQLKWVVKLILQAGEM